MNPFKWLVCWWHSTHVNVRFYDRTGKLRVKCVRCSLPYGWQRLWR